jgi:hypothetical protein
MSGPANPRDEAERLLAAALAGLSVATQATRGIATGSPECCVCPLCRAIAAVRDPSPQFAERLASSAGDLATGLAGVLRAFAEAAGSGPTKTPPPRSDDSGDVWSAATRAPGQSEPAAPPRAPGTKPMAKKAVKPTAKKATPPPNATEPGPGDAGGAGRSGTAGDAGGAGGLGTDGGETGGGEAGQWD